MDSDRATVNPFSPDISDEEFRRWASQFEEDEWKLVGSLLSAFRYYSSRAVRELCLRLFDEVPAPEPGLPRVYIPAGFVARSGSAIAYFFKTENGLSSEEFVAWEEVMRGALRRRRLDIVLLDDYIGTGRQATQLLSSLSDLIHRESRTTLAVLTATLSGRTLAESVGIGSVVVADPDPLPDGIGTSLPEGADSASAIDRLRKLGERAAPAMPLGFGNTAALVAFFYSTPNNTLPIFWSAENGWIPLFPRAGMDRHLEPVGSSDQLPSPRDESVTELAVAESQISSLSTDPEVTRIMIGEFQQLALAGPIAQALGELGMAAGTVAAWVQLVETLKVHEHEQAPVGSTIAVVAAGVDEHVCVRAADGVTLQDRARVVTLVELSGESGCIIADSNGAVLGMGTLMIDTVRGLAISARRLDRYLELSSATSGVVFTSDGHGRAAICARGALLARFVNQTWHVPLDAMPAQVQRIAQRAGVGVDVLRGLYRLALSIADERHGAFISLGDHDEVLAYCSAPAVDPLAWTPTSLFELAPSLVIGLMSADGASIVTQSGELHSTRVTVRVPPGVQAEVEVGAGTKHQTAAQLSAITRALTFAVSVDGRLSAYLGGSRVDRRYA